jgi:hypothetical protein
MPPPGMPPMRARGGKVAGGVRGQGPGDKMPHDPPGWTESAKHKTKVQHSDGKGDEIKDMNRPKPVTYARGGGVKHASTPVMTAPAKGGHPTVSRTEHAASALGGVPRVSHASSPAKPGAKQPAGGGGARGRMQKMRAATASGAP